MSDWVADSVKTGCFAACIGAFDYVLESDYFLALIREVMFPFCCIGNRTLNLFTWIARDSGGASISPVVLPLWTIGIKIHSSCSREKLLIDRLQVITNIPAVRWGRRLLENKLQYVAVLHKVLCLA